MTHDSLCPIAKKSDMETGGGIVMMMCACPLINVVRIDERKRSGERVADLPMAGSGVINRETAINAARGKYY